jgi:hypothetical protein
MIAASERADDQIVALRRHVPVIGVITGMPGCFGGMPSVRQYAVLKLHSSFGAEELMSTERPPVTNIIFGTMTLSYRGYGSRVHDTATAAAMLTMYSDAGYRALDTAHAYGGGSYSETDCRWSTSGGSV